jgi:hypothetical protein
MNQLLIKRPAARPLLRRLSGFPTYSWQKISEYKIVYAINYVTFITNFVEFRNWFQSQSGEQTHRAQLA